MKIMNLYRKVNKSLVSTEELSNKYDVLELKAMIEDHVKYTNSIRGKEILNDFEELTEVLSEYYLKSLLVTLIMQSSRLLKRNI